MAMSCRPGCEEGTRRRGTAIEAATLPHRAGRAGWGPPSLLPDVNELISVVQTEILRRKRRTDLFENTTPAAQSGIPVCANCGRRPGTVRMVFAAEGGRRASTLCEVCATQLFAAAGRSFPQEAGRGSAGP